MATPLPFGRAIVHRKSGKIVGPIAPIFTEDWPYRHVDHTETLWRYLDFQKFEDLLVRSALYFSRPDRFKDPFEGRFTKGNEIRPSESDFAFRHLYRFQEDQRAALDYHETHRMVVFISCWHRNTHDTLTMWDAYTESSDSVVVSTTVGALRAHLPPTIMQHGVTYKPINEPRTEFSHNSLFFYKPSEYSFEREYRLLRSPAENESFAPSQEADTFRLIPIPVRKVIHRIVIHPAASIRTQRNTHLLLRDYCPSRIATLSKIKN
jgi:hypothetical protein